MDKYVNKHYKKQKKYKGVLVIAFASLVAPKRAVVDASVSLLLSLHLLPLKALSLKLR